MKTTLVRDIPVGVLLIVISLYCVWAVQYLSGFPNVLPLMGILFASIAAYKLMIVGIDVIVGVEMKVKDD